MDITQEHYPGQTLILMPGRDVPFSEERWKRILELLQYREQEGPNGVFTICDNKKIASLRYTTVEEKISIYYFLMGVYYQQAFDDILNGMM